MDQKSIIDRRTILKTTAAAAMGMGLSGCAEQQMTSSGKISFNNADFYDKDGKFIVDKGKEACIELMKYHGYPIYPDIKEKLWVSDYGTGQFTKLGLGANMFNNNEKDRYMLMDLFILPNQMLPEHYHLETDNNPAKREGWLVRYGSSYIVGEGAHNLDPKVIIPICHMNGSATVNHGVWTDPGQFVELLRVTSRHWQYAGPEGAIVNEVANVHDNDGVRHSDTTLVFP